MRSGRVVVMAALAVVACKKREEAAPALPEPAVREAPPAAPDAAAAPACPAGERACAGDSVVQCTAAGAVGDTLERCRGACRQGACVDTCAVKDVELIYVVDNEGGLYSFDPRKLPGDPFHRIATLRCNRWSSLNSMAVDRYGIAWLNYHDGSVHRASVVDGQCAATGAKPRGAPKNFGMGFVSDGPKTDTEKLFVAGRRARQVTELATLDPSSSGVSWNAVARVTVVAEHPELTGTGGGRLFAYFPAPARGFVQELDRATGAPLGERWVVDARPVTVGAYAFAHWGGVFYVFTTVEDGGAAVHAISMETGKVSLVKDKLPMRIVGAGVSTCAPLLERADP